MMKIAIIAAGFPPSSVGGIQAQAQGWAAHLSADHRVTVITRQADPSEPLREMRNGFTVMRIPRPSLPLWRSVIEIRGIVRCLAQIDPRPDVVLCFGSSVPGFAGIRAGKRLKIPTLVWVRAEVEYRLPRSFLAPPYIRLISPWVLDHAGGVLVQSNKMRTDLLAELHKVSSRREATLRDKLLVVGNGIDIPELSPWNPEGRVLSVGRLIADKGMDAVIEACASADRPLVIAGDGAERPALAALAAARGADVNFTGFIGKDTLSKLYRQASVVVLASHSEGLPNVVLEAMAHGRPVVTTPVGGIPDVIEDGVNGLLVPPPATAKHWQRRSRGWRLTRRWPSGWAKQPARPSRAMGGKTLCRSLKPCCRSTCTPDESRLMNLAIIVRYFPPRSLVGGAELQAQAWAERLAGRHRVTVVVARCYEPGLADREERDGYDILRVRTPSGGRVGREALEVWAIARCIAGIEPQPDLLLCFMTQPAGLAGVAAGRRHRIPAVVWVRAEGEYRLGASRRRRLISLRVWAGASGVLVQSEAGRTDLLTELERIAPRKVSAISRKLAVIGNGVDIPVPSSWNPDGPVVSVGRLVADKGLDVVIDACAAARRPLVIAGDGPELGALRARGASLGADVRFTGFLDRERLSTLYRDASVMVLASRTEGLPSAMLEAMSHARPVVATLCGGIPSVINDGSNGLLVPVGDAASLAGVLNRLAADPQFAARLAAAGRVTAEQFSWDRVGATLEEFLERHRRRRGESARHAPPPSPAIPFRL